jgi:hypothetical protein
MTISHVCSFMVATACGLRDITKDHSFLLWGNNDREIVVFPLTEQLKCIMIVSQVSSGRMINSMVVVVFQDSSVHKAVPIKSSSKGSTWKNENENSSSYTHTPAHSCSQIAK